MIPLPAAALALGMSPARLRWLCAAGRVPGAKRAKRLYGTGKGWLIPEGLTREQIGVLKPGRKAKASRVPNKGAAEQVAEPLHRRTK